MNKKEEPSIDPGILIPREDGSYAYRPFSEVSGMIVDSMNRIMVESMTEEFKDYKCKGK